MQVSDQVQVNVSTLVPLLAYVTKSYVEPSSASFVPSEGLSEMSVKAMDWMQYCVEIQA